VFSFSLANKRFSSRNISHGLRVCGDYMAMREPLSMPILVCLRFLLKDGNLLDHVECDLASAHPELSGTNDGRRNEMGVVSSVANDRSAMASNIGNRECCVE